MTDDGDLNILTARTIAQVNRSPLQVAGRDVLVKTVQVGGPEEAFDRCMVVSVDLLERLLVVARQSVTRRVELARCGLLVKVWRRPDGSQYETWEVLGEARPERPNILLPGGSA